MNLFELFIKVGVDDQASSKLGSITSKLGNGLKTAAKIGTAAVATAAAGITALTTAAVKNYAEYEQLVGGVETLFKNSSKTVQKYAANAYKTAGMSANEYMSTATSFAASLINSFKDTSSEITEEMAEDMIESLDKQVEAFEEATDAQIKLINKQYNENLKLIDEEEYRRIKAIEDQIAAIEAEEEAEEAAIKKRQQAEEKARLQQLIDTAANAESRQKAEEKLAAYMQELAEEERKEARKNQIAELKDQKDAVKDEYDLKRDALKEQHDYELEAYKEARDKELAYLKLHLKEQEKVIKASIGTMTEDVSLSAEAYEEAAKATDMAISDMSDNANKMGTDIELIKNAYQGFAKQNYTMLDNLKLGYGGTKTEMERLIADAAKLDDSVDANSMSFGNIVKAIHAVQDEMGIYGTTAKEGASTISGSLQMTKAAWSNLITGIADNNADFDTLINNMVESVVAFAGNILPRIEVALNGIVKLIEGLFPKIINALPGLIKTVLPNITKGALNIVKSFVTAISDNGNLLVESAINSVMTWISEFYPLLPEILKLGLDLIVSLALGIAESLPTLIPTLVSTILMIVNTLTNPDMLSKILGAALVLVVNLAYGLMDAIPQLVDAALDVIDNLVVFLLDPENIAKLLNAAAHIVIALGSGIISALPRLLTSTHTLVAKVIQNIINTNWANVGKNIVDGIYTGISNAWKNLKEWFTSLFGDLIGIAKKILGIASPSKVFKKIGGFTAEGFGVGFEDEFAHVKDDMEDALNFDDASVGINASIRKVGAGTAGMAYGGVSYGDINIYVNGDRYHDENALAEALALKLQGMTDRRAAVFGNA